MLPTESESSLKHHLHERHPAEIQLSPCVYKNNLITVNNKIKDVAQAKTLTGPKDDIYSTVVW